MVSSLVVVPVSLGVPETAIPNLVAAGRSRCLPVRPVCAMNFKLGSWPYSFSLKLVRSRMSSKTLKSFSPATSFSEVSRRWRRIVTSARALSLS